MVRLPVIVGMGGVNPAGRISFHHAYRRMVIEALGASDARPTWRSLATMMELGASAADDSDQRQYILDHTLIRRQ